MFQTLDQLIHHVVATLPEPRTVTGIQRDETRGYITFQWSGRHLLIRKSGEAFEVRNQQVFTTGPSVLVQTVLRSRTQFHRIVESVSEAIRSAEDLFNDDKVESGLKILASAKITLQKLACHPTTI